MRILITLARILSSFFSKSTSKLKERSLLQELFCLPLYAREVNSKRLFIECQLHAL